MMRINTSEEDTEKNLQVNELYEYIQKEETLTPPSFSTILLPAIGTFVYFSTMLHIGLLLSAFIGTLMMIINPTAILKQQEKKNKFQSTILLCFVAFGPICMSVNLIPLNRSLGTSSLILFSIIVIFNILMENIEITNKASKEKLDKVKKLFTVILAAAGTYPFWADVVLADMHNTIAIQILSIGISIFMGWGTMVLISKKILTRKLKQ
jgi:hypothetical protein